MNEIKCPHCGKTFKVDESSFADIIKQVRDSEFDKALHEQVENAVRIANLEAQNQLKEEASRKDSEIAKLLSQLKEKEDEAKLIAEQTKNALQQDLSSKNSEIAALQSKLDAKETEKRLAVTEATNKLEKERDDLANKLESKDTEQKLLASSLKEKYESELKSKEEMIAYYKDMKAKLSTKMIGETLEQHCEYEFNRIRASAFPNAYFEKDNDTSDGTKGDYIYRETDKNGTEIISIMFEMKNEGDETATKHKNEDFLAKLDTDRKKKNCEYAVLVTLLEADSELYNGGIVDMGHKHPKMYVIRPQFFIPIITVLRNAALNSLKYKSELALVREQNIDITNFESELQTFQDGFMKNVKDSSNKFIDAMDGIDATIKKLEGIKEALRLSNKHLLTAGSKVEGVSVKRLTKNNPTMAEKFAELDNK